MCIHHSFGRVKDTWDLNQCYLHCSYVPNLKIFVYTDVSTGLKVCTIENRYSFTAGNFSSEFKKLINNS